MAEIDVFRKSLKVISIMQMIYFCGNFFYWLNQLLLENVIKMGSNLSFILLVSAHVPAKNIVQLKN